MNQPLTNLQRKAQKALLEDRRTKKHGIEVLEEEGVVTLKGSVPSRKVKKLAASILRDMRDIDKVINELQVNDENKILERILRCIWHDSTKKTNRFLERGILWHVGRNDIPYILSIPDKDSAGTSFDLKSCVF